MLYKKCFSMLLIMASLSFAQENNQKERHISIKNNSDYPMQAIIEQEKCRKQRRHALPAGQEKHLPVSERCKPKTIIIKSPDRPGIKFTYSNEYITGGEGEIRLNMRTKNNETLYWDIKLSGAVRHPVLVDAKAHSFKK